MGEYNLLGRAAGVAGAATAAAAVLLLLARVAASGGVATLSTGLVGVNLAESELAGAIFC